MTVRALIVDDEVVSRRRIRRLLQRETDVAIAGECADGTSAVTAIRASRPHLVFLDVQMPECDGFDVVQQIPPEELPAVIFVTAHDRFAVRAFDVHAIDYLLKPFTGERFRTALHRARERLTRRADNTGLRGLVSDLRARARYLRRLSVRTADRIVVLDVAAIDWLGAADNYVHIHAGGKEYLLRETLAALEHQLDPDRFVRIHRSALVQIDRILELRPATHGDFDVLLREGTRLSLSRTCRGRLEQALGRPL